MDPADPWDAFAACLEVRTSGRKAAWVPLPKEGEVPDPGNEVPHQVADGSIVDSSALAEDGHGSPVELRLPPLEILWMRQDLPHGLSKCNEWWLLKSSLRLTPCHQLWVGLMSNGMEARVRLASGEVLIAFLQYHRWIVRFKKKWDELHYIRIT